MLHLDSNVFLKFIETLSTKFNIPPDILEKDYYVCLILNNLSQNQDYLRAYFKGGTAVYKILDTENRFSEDIDLTVEVINEESNNSNRMRLKKSALGYNIEGLYLEKENTIDRKGSVTGFYRYNKFFDGNLPILKNNKIQVEATSFTESRPFEKTIIQPLIYKYANQEQKNILQKNFDIKPFPIITQTLERIFIDKIITAETYLEKEDYINVSKHLYDISILIETSKIQHFLNDKENISNILRIKRLEETRRYDGLEPDKKIVDFGIFNSKITEEIKKDFDKMQKIYIFDDKYKITLSQVDKTLDILYNILPDIEEKYFFSVSTYNKKNTEGEEM